MEWLVKTLALSSHYCRNFTGECDDDKLRQIWSKYSFSPNFSKHLLQTEGKAVFECHFDRYF